MNLNLNSNEIGAAGAKELSAALKDNHTLTTLDGRVEQFNFL